MNITVRNEFSSILFGDLVPGDAFISTDSDDNIYDKGVFIKIPDCSDGTYERNAVCLKDGKLWHISTGCSVAKFTGSLEVPYNAFERGKKDE